MTTETVETNQTEFEEPNTAKPKDTIQDQIEALKIDLTPKPTPLSNKRTVLIIRDLPSNITPQKILDLFPEKSSRDPNSPPCRDDVLSIDRSYWNNWEVRFTSEEMCVKSALHLQSQKIDEEIVHCRVKNQPTGEINIKVSKSPYPSRSGGSNEFLKYADYSPAFCRPMTISSYSPILSPMSPMQRNEALLEHVKVPEGVFGESPIMCVSPMSPILNQMQMSANGNRAFTPPNFFDFSKSSQSDFVQKKYRKMLEMKQSKDSAVPNFFPVNMVKSLGKNKVKTLLEELSLNEYERPNGFYDADGNLQTFAREIPIKKVLYGGDLPEHNPNSSDVLKC